MMICKVCTHDNRSVIEDVISSGLGMRVIAAQFGLSKDIVHRHKLRHMGATNGSNGATHNGNHNPVRRDAAFERDYWTLVACFAPGVPQSNGKLQLADTVRAWSREKKNQVFQEALNRGDLVLYRHGDSQYVERPESRHVAGETGEN